jgi:hypothetical protein
MALHEKTVRVQTSKMGPDHRDTCAGRNGLAETYLAAGRTAEAIRLHEQNLRLSMMKRGPNHPDTLLSRNNLARAYCAVGQFAKSEPMLRECLAIREKIQPDDWWTFSTRSQLGVSLLGQKKFAEAEPLILLGYDEMRAREARIPAPLKNRLAEAEERVVKLYDDWGKPEKAAEWRAKLAPQPPVEKNKPKP